MEKYRIRNNKLQIDDKTLHYWKGFAIPAYLFVIVQKTSGEELDCYYRRYTSVLTGKYPDQSGEYYEGFYRADNGVSFIAFKDSNNRMQGFARDLFIPSRV